MSSSLRPSRALMRNQRRSGSVATMRATAPGSAARDMPSPRIRAGCLGDRLEVEAAGVRCGRRAARRWPGARSWTISCTSRTPASASTRVSFIRPPPRTTRATSTRGRPATTGRRASGEPLGDHVPVLTADPRGSSCRARTKCIRGQRRPRRRTPAARGPGPPPRRADRNGGGSAEPSSAERRRSRTARLM